MYLKKVEIQGFKSFADRTDIAFNNEITAVVGPNGSGKSNISDAIRWVLGEQSVKNLRGTKMEDIIFSGTDKRRALGYAEVTITFDNSLGTIPIEYTEIAVTRRMFRSGDSEYYLNKNSCRLKDVRELFMDSGIGKDGYSIIGQGKIDEILSNKPEDRRNIFEEAAGIIKYRNKKEESERKLNKTESNLVRIKDLIHEVSGQHDSMEIEAEKAVKYNKLYTRLKDLEVNLYIKEIKKLEIQIGETNKSKAEVETELGSLEEERVILEEKYNSLKKNIESMDAEIEKSREIKFEAIQTYENSKNQISLYNEKESFLVEDLDRLLKQRDELEVSLAGLSQSRLEMDKRREESENKYNELKSILDTKLSQQESLKNRISDFEQNIESKKENSLHLHNLSSSTKNEINSIENYKESTGKRVEKLSGEGEKINLRIEELKETESSLKIESNRLNQERNTKLESIKLLTNNISELEKELKSLEDNIRDRQIKLNGLNSSYHLYKNMEDSYEGYYKSVKGLINAANRNSDLIKGLVGVVADLIKVSPQYERAIEISLGSNVQNLVVETEKDAKKLIEYLKINKLGRATFLPISTIRGKTITLNQSDIKEYSILGLGHELITFDPKYKDIFEFLLGRTIIVKDIDNGIKLAKKYGHIHRIVTLEGEVLNTGGSISGGSYGKENISIITRKNKIESLSKEILIVKGELESIENNKSHTEKNIDDLKDSVHNQRQLLNSLEEELTGIRNSINQNEYEINRSNIELKGKLDEIQELRKEMDWLTKKQENLSVSLEKLENEIKENQDTIQEYSLDFSGLRQSRDQMEEEIISLKLELNTLENSLISLSKEAENYSLTKENLLSSKISNEKEIVEKDNSLKEIKDLRDSLSMSIKDYESREKEIAEKLSELVRKKDSYMKNFYDEQDRLKVINKRISDMEKSKGNMEVRLTRYELQSENNLERLREDYELDYEQALRFERDITDVTNISSDIKGLKEEIRSLGNVNLSAIEEFKNLSERLDFISKQQQDLLHAKDDLKEVIKDMEKKMKEQFMTSFEKINESFSEVFAILFNGGKARLELEESENILEAGIEIKVQPPGKRLQNLSLLSGGEKSLTAVALLFAILNTKPAPFCILDEIDAALDEANISRYINYLKTYREKTQFILITHRKTTMEIADTLYGVTMEEEGVSKLISVELKNKLIEAS